MRLFILLASTVALLGGCRAQPAANTSFPTPKLAQWSGAYGGQAAFAVRKLDSAAWGAFWEQVGREKPRELDPAREMAVVVFLGQRNTGGYSIEIASVRAEEKRLVVEYRESAPSPDMMVTQALTAPWAIAIVPRSGLPVTAQKLPASNAREQN